MSRATTRIFRVHHDSPAEPIHDPMAAALVEEWIDLNRSAAASSTVSRWGHDEPALAAYTAPWEIVDAIDAADRAMVDEILGALLRTFHAGSQLAGRILLQVFLPKLSRMRDHRDASGPWAVDRDQAGLAEFWDVITTYPIERRATSVSGGIVLDTLHKVTGRRTHPTAWDAESPTQDQHLEWWINERTSDQRDVVADDVVRDDLEADDDLVTVIAWGVKNDAISQSDGQLLLAYYGRREDGVTADQVAADAGVSHAALRQRCSRARRNLVEAARTAISQTHTEPRATVAS